MKCIRASASLVILAMAFYAFGACGVPAASYTRPPAVAGRFYPSDPNKLKLAIQLFLKDATEKTTDEPIAIIVPHAGYIFAGQIYADAYRQIAGHQYDVVVVLGTNHTTSGFSGVSLGDYTAFRTPLGDVAVDEEVVSALLAESKECVRSREVHIAEHSIEVQIPFIQSVCPNAKIVPAVINPPDFKMCVRFGQALGKVLKNRRALIVISSDLSHYPDSRNGARADRQTLMSIAKLDLNQFASLMQVLDAPNLETRACGEAPIISGITAAKILGASRSTVVGYANSGDVAVGDQSRTVGYGAVVLTAGNAPTDTSVLDRPAPPSNATPLQSSEKKALLSFARETIRRYLTTETVPLARRFSARMDFPQGVFVTLNKHGQLRGCIGHIPPDYELGKNVGAMAIQAAFNDPRFQPVTLQEVKDLEIEISVLTPLKSISTPEEIVVGRDGVLMSQSGRSAVFLPQVAPENGWGRTEMLDNLCLKAGLASGCWKRNAHFEVFQADVFSEKQFK
jgi:AmmeMemoRadiSam system protein B/AmmeMemoRadiSam system protein A